MEINFQIAVHQILPFSFDIHLAIMPSSLFSISISETTLQDATSWQNHHHSAECLWFKVFYQFSVYWQTEAERLQPSIYPSGHDNENLKVSATS